MLLTWLSLYLAYVIFVLYIENVDPLHQVTQQSEVTSEVNNKLESYLTNSKSQPYNTVDDLVEILLLEGSNMPNSNPIKTKKTFFKCKRKESIK